MNLEGVRLGVVVSGSVKEGVVVKLDGAISVEEIAVGRHVTIEGEKCRFFGIITDVQLEALDPRLPLRPPQDAFTAQVLSGTAIYGTLKVLPLLALPTVLGVEEAPQPAKTIPAHFAPVHQASQRDIEVVFGKEDERRFYIGNPLDMETKVCLNLEELVKRSNGVFGKSGTGKTYLTRWLLIGILQKGKAANLVFDMHSEYGWEGGSEQGRKVKGLKQLFSSRVAVFSLDEESARRRRVNTDYIVHIGYDEIEPEDMELLRETLNLTEAAIHACHRLARHFGDRHWVERFLSLEGEEVVGLAKALGEHEATFQHLRRRLERLKGLPFLVPHAPDNAVHRILEYLDRGLSVVLEFGRYTDTLAYILVANLLSRRIHSQYRERMEQALGQDLAPPRPLVITIEEAHRFLNPALASQTIFGTIAREMRKYNVTLLVVDQRPSGIDEEIMSQLGTKVCCLLDNERDIESVFTGVPGKGELKAVLSRLETKQQALLFGHALPMPIVVHVREYGSAQSYKELGLKEPAEMKRSVEKDIAELWE